MVLKDKLNGCSQAVIGAAISVHQELGPGLLESDYKTCLQYELLDRGHRVERQMALPVYYRGQKMDVGFRIDLLVDDCVVVELKACDRVEKIHEAQLQTYLKLMGLNLGRIMNFNVLKLVDGIKRVVRDFPD